MSQEYKYLYKLRRGIKDDSINRNDWVEYEKKADHIKPQEAEIVCEIDNGIPKIKIGDGINNVNDLPFANIDSEGNFIDAGFITDNEEILGSLDAGFIGG